MICKPKSLGQIKRRLKFNVKSLPHIPHPCVSVSIRGLEFFKSNVSLRC